MDDHYQQPSFYHFSRDSISLAQYIASLEDLSKGQHILEVGAGCGVITCELFKAVTRRDVVVTLIELQEEFKEVLEANCSYHLQIPYQIQMGDFLAMNLEGKQWQLIYLNPPYFFIENSRPSEDKNKDQCRRISRESFKQLVQKCWDHLYVGGRLIFCHREGELNEVFTQMPLAEKLAPQEKDGCWIYSFKK